MTIEQILEIIERYKLLIPPTVYYELLADVREAEEEQEPTTKNDLVLIHTEGLDEEIRCTMCTNHMKSDRGCDGSCVVNKDMYKAVMDAIEKRIQPTTKNDLGVDCISRADVLNHLANIAKVKAKSDAQKSLMGRCLFMVESLPSVTPQEPRCKDCKWWKDSDGKYRRGCGAESQCPINNNDVYCGDGYCYMFSPKVDMREVEE